MSLYNILNKSRISPITKKINVLHHFPKVYLHQDYYHPYDVPIYQTPPLGDNKNLKQEKLPIDFVCPLSNIDTRNPYYDHNYIKHGQDFPSFINYQTPEKFLPEEPTFLEFWGYSPFLLLSTVFVLSKEYIMFNGSSHISTIYIPPVIFTFMCLYDAFNKIVLPEYQFMIDTEWTAASTLKWAYDEKIKECQNNLRTKENVKNFDRYLRTLTNLKVGYYAHLRKMKLANLMLTHLNTIKLAEEKYFRDQKFSLYQDLDKFEQESYYKNKKWLDKWHKKSISFIKNYDPNDKSMNDENIKLIPLSYEKFLKEREGNTNLKTEKEPDKTMKYYFEKIYSILTSLRIYDGPKEIPKKYIPQLTGLHGKLSEKQKEAILSKKDLKVKKMKVINELIKKFKKGCVPEVLLEKKAKIDSE